MLKRISDQVSDREIAIIVRELSLVLHNGIVGDVVEFGCYVGTTSLFLQKTLLDSGQKRQLHVYDSFAGLPEKTAPDISPAGEQFKAGELRATKAELIKNFQHAGLEIPHIHKAWFGNLTEADVPSSISFAFLDGDYYSSIMDPLNLLWPRLTAGAVILIDDYQSEQLPGVEKAVTEWSKNHTFNVSVESSLAIIRV